MKRFVLLLLIALLPLQLSAALLEGYQKNVASVQHQEHQMHEEHQAHPSTDAAVQTPDSACVHPECGLCHLACCPILSSSTSPTSVAPLRTLAVGPSGVENSVALAPPYRPNW